MDKGLKKQCSRLIFDALQTRSNLAVQYIRYLSQNQPFEMQPRIEHEDVAWRPPYNVPATRTSMRKALSLQEVEADGWFLILNIVLENKYHIIHAQVEHEFCILFLYSWIDVLVLNHPFTWRAKIWEPFKMKLIWGLQSWTLIWRPGRFTWGPKS